MVQLLAFILVNYGIVVSISKSKLLKKFREYCSKKSLALGMFLSCEQCLGLWTSIPAYLLVYRSFSSHIIDFCLIGTGSAYIFWKLLNK